MKQVSKLLGQVARRLSREQRTVKSALRPQELDAKVLKQVSGGTGTSTGTPNKGW
jgi:hypothetical protein